MPDQTRPESTGPVHHHPSSAPQGSTKGGPADTDRDDWPAIFKQLQGDRTYAEMARLAGVGERLPYKWMTGERKPDMATVRDLARGMRIPPLDLLVRAGYLRPDEVKKAPPYADPLIGHIATLLQNPNLPEPLRAQLRTIIKGAFHVWLEINGAGGPPIAEPSGDQLTRLHTSKAR